MRRPAKNRVTVRIRDAQGGWLVLHEQWARGWRAEVDGTEIPVLRADHVYRAVLLPAGSGPGEHVVEFRYDPPALDWGVVVSLVALVGVVVWELLNRG